MKFVARVLVQIPDPRRHLGRYYGTCSNASRGKRKKATARAEPSPSHQPPRDEAVPDGAVPRRPSASVGGADPPGVRS
jgi:hypothetical protein